MRGWLHFSAFGMITCFPTLQNKNSASRFSCIFSYFLHNSNGIAIIHIHGRSVSQKSKKMGGEEIPHRRLCIPKRCFDVEGTNHWISLPEFSNKKNNQNRKRDPIKDSNLVLRYVDSSPYLTFSEESSTMKKNFAFFCLLQDLLSVFRSGQING